MDSNTLATTKIPRVFKDYLTNLQHAIRISPLLHAHTPPNNGSDVVKRKCLLGCIKFYDYGSALYGVCLGGLQAWPEMLLSSSLHGKRSLSPVVHVPLAHDCV